MHTSTSSYPAWNEAEILTQPLHPSHESGMNLKKQIRKKECKKMKGKRRSGIKEDGQEACE